MDLRSDHGTHKRPLTGAVRALRRWQAVEGARSLQDAYARVCASFRDYAANAPHWRRLRTGYLRALVNRYRFYVEPDASVLEIGVGTGDLLAALGARRAVGVDICEEMIEVARESHPELELHHCAGEDLHSVEGPFDYIILSDVTVYLYDILAVLRELNRLSHPRTRLIINLHSRLWQPALSVLVGLGLHHAHDLTNWVTPEDLQNLLELADFQVVRQDVSTLLPAEVPGLSQLANRYLYRLPILRQACLVNWIVARPRRTLPPVEELTVSVVCPCRNEAGNVPSIVDRTPRLGKHTELLLVEGNSTDDTWAAICKEVEAQRNPQVEVRALRQSGKGKGNAVRDGFAQARGDVLLILDADLTVAPEDLHGFVAALQSGTGEMINGSRLVYPMDPQAMRFLNLLGNKFFARVFSTLLDQPLKDTLCGTKVITATDYARLARGRSYFGEFDPFGDFDLLFGAAKLGLRIIEFPVRYGERTYGDTNIRRFRDGWLLLRMSWVALRRLKFADSG